MYTQTLDYMLVPLLVLRSIRTVRAWHTIGLSSTLSLRALPSMRASIGKEVLRSVGSKQNLGNSDQIYVEELRYIKSRNTLGYIH